MSRDLSDKLEQARRAVESAYAGPGVDAESQPEPGDPDAGAGAGGGASGPPAIGPAAGFSLTAGAGPLSRARGLARGAPASARAGTAWWRRPLKGLMARLIRFETAWQHEFNLATADAVGEIVQELVRVTGRLDESAVRLARLQESVAALEDRLNRHDAARRRLEAALAEAREASGALAARLEAESRRAATAHEGLERRIQKAARASEQHQGAVRKDLNRFRNQVGEVLRAGEKLRRGLLDAAQRLTQLEKESLSYATLEERLAPVTRELAGLNQSLEKARQAGLEAAAHQRRDLERLAAGQAEVSSLWDRRHGELREDLAGLAARMSAAAGRLEEIGGQLRLQEPDLDGLEFARRFRGSEAEIRRRLAPYVALLAETPATREGPVLEIGSGRGEFLGLCREAGLEAIGLEPNPALAAHAQAAGLDVRAVRALPYLGALGDAGLGGIFSAQVIEHLAPGVLTAFIRESFRVLRPGGLLLLETLNPACLSILATTFYLDPSHRAPVHPDTARFLLESAGFVDVQVITHTPVPAGHRLTPVPAPSQETAGLAAVREHLNRELEILNHLLFSDQEYHVRGTRP